MKKEEYEGWSNWDTWNANLHIANDEQLYNVARLLLTGQDLFCLWLDAFGTFHDDIDIRKVDWEEILQSLKE